jgi:hypothetical protein
MRFKCNGVLFYNSTLNSCGVGGCAGESLGTGTVQKGVDAILSSALETRGVMRRPGARECAAA